MKVGKKALIDSFHSNPFILLAVSATCPAPPVGERLQANLFCVRIAALSAQHTTHAGLRHKASRTETDSTYKVLPRSLEHPNYLKTRYN